MKSWIRDAARCVDRGSRYIRIHVHVHVVYSVALAARGGAHRTPPSKFVLGREREREKGVVRNYM